MPDSETDDKKFIEYLQGYLGDSYSYAYNHFQRKDLIQRMFDGDIEPGEYGTMSELYIPVLRSAVKKMMPDIVQYVFPTSGFTSLVPMKGGVTFDAVKEFEQMLDNLMQHRMNIRKSSIPILQDALKFGAGYGIVEKAMVTTEESGVFSVMEKGRFVAKERGMRISSTPQLMPRLRYLQYEQVIPSPDGSDPDSASCVMVIDYYREDEFRDLYKSQEASNDRIYVGDPDKIIEDTRKLEIGGGMYPHFWNIMIMSGETTATMQSKYRKVHEIAVNRSNDKFKAPIMIPVVKYYFKREHVWVANGRTIIMHDKDSYETLRCPVIKASPDIDSNNWWALSDVAASRDMAYGVNAYSNAMMDLLGQYLRPMIVYDQSRYGGSEVPRYEPWGVIPMNGSIKDAFETAKPAPLAPGMLDIGQLMKQNYDEVNMNPLNGQQTPGMVRGGSHAFESLLQTTNGPREMSGLILDMGFIEPLIKQVMIQVQTLPQETYEYIDLKDRTYTENRITLNDVRYAFDVSTDLREKVRNSINEKMADMTMYQQVYKDNPRIRQNEALEMVIGDKEKSRKLMATKAEYEENVKQLQQSANPERPMTQGQQAAQGFAGRNQ